jgi:hypothetical protein
MGVGSLGDRIGPSRQRVEKRGHDEHLVKQRKALIEIESAPPVVTAALEA